MRLDPETRRRSILPLLVGLLAVVYLFVFLPLDRRANSLDAPLNESWKQLAITLGRTNAFLLDFVSLTNQIAETRTAVTAFQIARQQARERVELDPALQDLLTSPFLLVDYRIEAGRRMDALARLAKQEGVVLDPPVLTGFPQPSAEMKEPSLLWAELAFLDSLMTTAINAKVGAIHFIAAPLPLTNVPPVNNGRSLAELPLQFELTGPILNVARFLQTLPLRSEEIEAAGLPAAPTNKPALFIERIVLRKQSPGKPDEVHLALRAVGFVFQKGSKH